MGCIANELKFLWRTTRLRWRKGDVFSWLWENPYLEVPPPSLSHTATIFPCFFHPPLQQPIVLKRRKLITLRPSWMSEQIDSPEVHCFLMGCPQAIISPILSQLLLVPSQGSVSPLVLPWLFLPLQHGSPAKLPDSAPPFTCHLDSCMPLEQELHQGRQGCYVCVLIIP